MPPRLWQRQPDESPADFTAFAAYLRLKGRRTHRATAEATGRPLGTIRRLSARYNWSGRVAAFEYRLADATQSALDGVIQSAITASKSDLESFRIKEFLLAHQVIHASHRWLDLATNPRRHQVSLTQICRLTEMAFKLPCLATGMPFGDEPRRRPRPEDRPGYWTAPTVEEALQKIYGSPLPGESAPAAATPPDVSAGGGIPSGSGGASVPTSPASGPGNAPSSTTASPGLPASPVPRPEPETPPPPRSDVWSRWARHQRRLRS